MKIYLLTTIIVLSMLGSFAKAKAQQYEWGSWKTPTCYNGIQSRCRLGEYNEFAKQYSWEVEIKNNYSKKVSITFDVKNSSMDGRTVIEPGKTDKSSLLNASSIGLDIEFLKLCFHHPNGFDQCSDYEQNGYASYATCDNGAPNYTVYNVSGKNGGGGGGAVLTQQNGSSSNSSNNHQSGNHHNCSNMIYAGQPQGYQKCGCCGQVLKTDYKLPSNCNLSAQSCGSCVDKGNTAVASNNNTANRSESIKKNERDAAINYAITETTKLITDVITSPATPKSDEYIQKNLTGDGYIFDNFTKDVIIELESIGFNFQNIIMKDEAPAKKVNGPDNISIKSRRLLFLYDGSERSIDISCTYFDKVGSYFTIIISCKDDKELNTIKKLKPQKNFGKCRTEKFINSFWISSIKYNQVLHNSPYEIYKVNNSVKEDLPIEDSKNANNTKYIHKGGELYEMGFALFKKKDYKGALVYFDQAISVNNPQAKYIYARMYEDGLGLPQNHGLALVFYAFAANGGWNSAHNDVARFYAEGIGVEQNLDSAFVWYLKGAERGDLESMNAVGTYYREGKGVSPDSQKALMWLTKSAEAGEPYAMSNLGKMYYLGNGISKDETQAKFWFVKACDKGLHECCDFVKKFME